MGANDDDTTPEDITPVSLSNINVLGMKARKRKLKQICRALSENSADVDTLTELAISEGGLIEDCLRQKVWPKLLDIDPYEVSPKPTLTQILNHKEYTQVLLDVKRCLSRFPPGIPSERRFAMQDQLTNLIVRILIKHPQLCYYQGYHDICVTFLLVVGEEPAFALLEKLSTTSLKLFMEPTMESTVHILNYVCPIVGKFSPNLRRHLEAADVSTVFCLSWLITWFGHVLNNYNQIVRLYDFFLATHDLMPVYLAAAIVLYRQEEVLALEPDMAIIHHFLSNVPDDLPFERLILDAINLFYEYPPEEVIRDYEKSTRTGKGFYHRWISSSNRENSLRGIVSNNLRNVWHYVNPNDGSTRWRLLAVASVIFPVALAFYFFNFSFDKISKRLSIHP